MQDQMACYKALISLRRSHVCTTVYQYLRILQIKKTATTTTYTKKFAFNNKIDPFHKWLPIINSFVIIKISLTNLVFEFLVSRETVVLRRWERSKQEFGFIKRVDKG